MDQKNQNNQKDLNNERFVVFFLSLVSLGLILENIVMRWENWVPLVVLAGIFSIWFVHLSGEISSELRSIYYFFYAAIILFYHGVHKNGVYDVALTAVIAMITFSLLEYVYMIHIFLTEYFVVIAGHLLELFGTTEIVFDRVNITRLLLHTVVVLLVYVICVRTVNNSIEAAELDQYKDARIEAYDIDMEDFLSNISHELRTPVNVVNGMSDLLIKRNVGYEADSIKAAGIRLAYQIEDIQDYTECKRHKVIPEEESYTSISLINDVVASFRLLDKQEELELVVDMDPKVPTKMIGDIKKLHKIFRHLLENGVKFTKKGGIYVRMYTENEEYGVNLCIEMTDTGVGMDRRAIESVSEGMYQSNKERNRSSGGIGLGLYIVYGFAHRMGGFVKIESEKWYGTTVRVTVPQKVVDESPCLTLSDTFDGAVLFHVKQDKYEVPRLRDFYRNMATNLASGIRVPLYSAETVNEIERLKEKVKVSHVFMGEEEYRDNPEYFEALCKEGIIVAVSCSSRLHVSKGSGITVMPKPLYAYPVIKILNGEHKDGLLDAGIQTAKPEFKNVKALIVDDEPMNLVVATGIFRDYGMIIDTAGSGREAIQKFSEETYDIIFMDHMMPEMDGVEAMKQIRNLAADLGRNVIIVVLTANAVSGAREMFMKEGFDGFIAKPINTADFERVMLRELPESMIDRGVQKA